LQNVFRSAGITHYNVVALQGKHYLVQSTGKFHQKPGTLTFGYEGIPKEIQAIGYQ